ncbi:MAG: energy transducer TonB [Erythrobacter sp.]
MRAPRHPEPAGVQRVNSVDIPQWAKDEGHNGTASFIALVGADSRLIRLELDRSSGSPAIDAAARERAESLYYMAATDASGAKVEGTVKVRLGYARHDPDSPGGGLDDYTCRDLVKEYRWFARANAGVRRIFWLENAYTSMDVLGQLQSGAVPSLEQRQKQRAVREKQWKALLKRCEKAPDGLFLDQVEERDNYLRLVNAF